LITINDIWSGVPSIIGYRGDDVTTATGTDPRTLTAHVAVPVIDVNANATNPDTNTSGGVTEFALADPTIALQGSGTADAPYIVIHLDATGRQNITFASNIRDIDGSADNAVQQVVVQYRTSATGSWINVAYVADATTGGSATQVTAINVTLPADANNAAELEIRIMTTNAVGNDEWVGIDDIEIDSEPIAVGTPGTLSIADASLVEGNSGTQDISFVVNRTGGSTGAVSATWTVSFPGTADTTDFAPGTLFTGTVSFADGATSATITLPIAGDLIAEPNETFIVSLSAPTGGASLGDAEATGTITNDELPPLANVFINEIHYDNASTDVGEAIEVAGIAGTDLTGWSLVLYNGNGGANYATIALSGVIADQNNGYGTISALATGIQNGSPDGIALVDNFGRVVQFLSYEGTMAATAGPASGLTSIDIGVNEEPGPAAGLSLQLVGSGSSYADFTWVAGVADNFGAVNTGQSFLSTTGPSQFRVGDVGVAEGNSGLTSLAVIVYRAGGLSNAASVDFAITLDGTANAADLMPGALLSGTLNFAAGESQRTILIPVQGDVTGESNETLTISLSNVSGANSIIDPSAVGTIINDDPVPLTIMQIQGEAHLSAYIGQPVVTTGIVTAVAGNGFYLQDASGDANIRTSDAIFVFTTVAPSVAVGDSLSVSGTVAEFTGAAGALSVTQINTPTVTVSSTGNSLPATVLIGQGGRLPPTEWINDDGLAIYDPENDGIDFWESLEGMRVTLDAPQAVANTNSFGETYVVASGGVGASGVNAKGGITISPNDATPGTSLGDLNPEMIQIDDNAVIFPGFVPNYTVGDRLSNVTGIVNYGFGTYEVIVTETVTVTSDVTIVRETSALVGTPTGLTIATYNLANLDPTDARFNLLANDIVLSLLAPDILAVQEIQDADGAGTGTNLSGAVTAQLLIDAIVAAGGPTYTYIEVAPTTVNTTGGEPNGNIRNGFLYNASRVNFIPGSLTQIVDPAFTNSRSPLVASFAFNGQVVTAINVHFTSRGGSEDLWGANQPPANAGEAARTAQIAAVNAYVNNHLATNPAYDVAVLGDFNGFYFEAEQLQLVDNGGLLVNIGAIHLPEEELYSYLFEGNSQLLDNIYASTGLVGGSFYDAVHINALFNEATRPTDHDPQIALFTVEAGITVFGDENPNALNGSFGNDSIFGLDQNDEIYGLEGEDRLIGGAGVDYLSGGNGNDRLWGGAGDDIMVGGDLDDVYYVEGNDIIVEYLNQGGDTAIASASYVLTAGSYVEFLQTSDDNLTISINLTGNELDNQISGNAGFNQLFGNAGNDILSGYLGNDELYGEDGNDSLFGDEDDDYLSGGNGIDHLEGSFGADIMLGGNDNDSYFAESSDLVVEYVGGGDDTVYAQSDFQLAAGSEIETLTIEATFGASNFNLFGNEFANAIVGTAGVNRIDGGLGNDTLSGGANLDYFEFSTALGVTNVDTIIDFASVDDILLIDQRVFTGSGLSAGFLNATAFLSGNDATVATDAPHRFIHDSATGDLYYDADGVGGQAAIKFANIGSGTAIEHYDLYLI
jgi:uncharacterized protein